MAKEISELLSKQVESLLNETENKWREEVKRMFEKHFEHGLPTSTLSLNRNKLIYSDIALRGDSGKVCLSFRVPRDMPFGKFMAVRFWGSLATIMASNITELKLYGWGSDACCYDIISYRTTVCGDNAFLEFEPIPLTGLDRIDLSFQTDPLWIMMGTISAGCYFSN